MQFKLNNKYKLIDRPPGERGLSQPFSGFNAIIGVLRYEGTGDNLFPQGGYNASIRFDPVGNIRHQHYTTQL